MGAGGRSCFSPVRLSFCRRAIFGTMAAPRRRKICPTPRVPGCCCQRVFRSARGRGCVDSPVRTEPIARGTNPRCQEPLRPSPPNRVGGSADRAAGPIVESLWPPSMAAAMPLHARAGSRGFAVRLAPCAAIRCEYRLEMSDYRRLAHGRPGRSQGQKQERPAPYRAAPPGSAYAGHWFDSQCALGGLGVERGRRPLPWKSGGVGPPLCLPRLPNRPLATT